MRPSCYDLSVALRDGPVFPEPRNPSTSLSESVLVGPNGVGKTMILKNAAHQAVVRGPSVRFATASDMLADLADQDSSSALARRLRRYTVPNLLCVDEVGYLSYDSRYADLLFGVVTRRYDLHKPILLSTNKTFSEWSQVFPHAACVVTLVDRLIHRAEVIEMEGPTATVSRKPRTSTPHAPRTVEARSPDPVHRSPVKFAAQGALFTGELHRIPAGSDARQHPAASQPRNSRRS